MHNEPAALIMTAAAAIRHRASPRPLDSPDAGNSYTVPPCGSILATSHTVPGRLRPHDVVDFRFAAVTQPLVFHGSGILRVCGSRALHSPA